MTAQEVYELEGYILWADDKLRSAGDVVEENEHPFFDKGTKLVITEKVPAESARAWMLRTGWTYVRPDRIHFYKTIAE